MKRKPEHIKQEDWNSVDSPPLSEELLNQMESVSKHHRNIPRRVRGRQKNPIKVPISLRLSPEVLEFFKSKGKGWQTNIDSILKEYIKEHEQV